ncbi:MAG TPA: hypothetical protein PKC28_09055 [Bdellovibrionales bacterium]|nr:hypothetical protein [Bdellovibrionales bacterium]
MRNFLLLIGLLLLQIFITPHAAATTEASLCWKAFVYLDDGDLNKLDQFLQNNEDCHHARGPKGENLATFALDRQNVDALILIAKRFDSKVFVTKDGLGRTVFSIVAAKLDHFLTFPTLFLDFELKDLDPVTSLNVADLLWFQKDQAGLKKAFDLDIKAQTLREYGQVPYELFALLRGFDDLVRHIVEKKSIPPHADYDIGEYFSISKSRELVPYGPFKPVGIRRERDTKLELADLFVFLDKFDLVRFLIQRGYQPGPVEISTWIQIDESVAYNPNFHLFLLDREVVPQAVWSEFLSNKEYEKQRMELLAAVGNSSPAELYQRFIESGLGGIGKLSSPALSDFAGKLISVCNKDCLEKVRFLMSWNHILPPPIYPSSLPWLNFSKELFEKFSWYPRPMCLYAFNSKSILGSQNPGNFVTKEVVADFIRLGVDPRNCWEHLKWLPQGVSPAGIDPTLLEYLIDVSAPNEDFFRFVLLEIAMPQEGSKFRDFLTYGSYPYPEKPRPYLSEFFMEKLNRKDPRLTSQVLERILRQGIPNARGGDRGSDIFLAWVESLALFNNAGHSIALDSISTENLCGLARSFGWLVSGVYGSSERDEDRFDKVWKFWRDTGIFNFSSPMCDLARDLRQAPAQDPEDFYKKFYRGEANSLLAGLIESVRSGGLLCTPTSNPWREKFKWLVSFDSSFDASLIEKNKDGSERVIRSNLVFNNFKAWAGDYRGISYEMRINLEDFSGLMTEFHYDSKMNDSVQFGEPVPLKCEPRRQ